MKRLVAIVVMVGAGILVACSNQPSPTADKIVMFPAPVGEKTELYQVVSPNALALAPGVKFQVADGPCGKNSGIVLLRPNGQLGGYMACGCIGATTSSCVTVSDNPDHPSCSGSCTDSEGNPHGCGLFGPIIGPPRNPFSITLSAR
jgi:hypothetical protein